MGSGWVKLTEYEREPIMDAALGQFIGALVPTFLISRLILWILRSWDGGSGRYITAHAISLSMSALVAGMGMADGGAFAPLNAAMIYAIPQGIWLMVDLIRTASSRDLQFATPKDDTTLKASQSEIVFWESIRNSSNAADFEAYLRQFPNGVFFRLAQNRLIAIRGY